MRYFKQIIVITSLDKQLLAENLIIEYPFSIVLLNIVHIEKLEWPLLKYVTN